MGWVHGVVTRVRSAWETLTHSAGPLEGAPSIRRLKVYTAQTGYVYHYFFAGTRSTRTAAGPATEYVFQVSRDRRSYTAISIVLPERAHAEWSREHERELSANEQYAVAKLMLFGVFDEEQAPERLRRRIQAGPADFEAIGETLGFD